MEPFNSLPRHNSSTMSPLLSPPPIGPSPKRAVVFGKHFQLPALRISSKRSNSAPNLGLKGSSRESLFYVFFCIQSRLDLVSMHFRHQSQPIRPYNILIDIICSRVQYGCTPITILDRKPSHLLHLIVDFLTYIRTYIYIYVCVCVCLSLSLISKRNTKHCYYCIHRIWTDPQNVF